MKRKNKSLVDARHLMRVSNSNLTGSTMIHNYFVHGKTQDKELQPVRVQEVVSNEVSVGNTNEDIPAEESIEKDETQQHTQSQFGMSMSNGFKSHLSMRGSLNAGFRKKEMQRINNGNKVSI